MKYKIVHSEHWGWKYVVKYMGYVIAIKDTLSEAEQVVTNLTNKVSKCSKCGK